MEHPGGESSLRGASIAAESSREALVGRFESSSSWPSCRVPVRLPGPARDSESETEPDAGTVTVTVKTRWKFRTAVTRAGGLKFCNIIEKIVQHLEWFVIPLKLTLECA